MDVVVARAVIGVHSKEGIVITDDEIVMDLTNQWDDGAALVTGAPVPQVGNVRLPIPAVPRSMIAGLATGVQQQVGVHAPPPPPPPPMPVIRIDHRTRSVEENVASYNCPSGDVLKPDGRLLLEQPELSRDVANEPCIPGLETTTCVHGQVSLCRWQVGR